MKRIFLFLIILFLTIGIADADCKPNKTVNKHGIIFMDYLALTSYLDTVQDTDRATRLNCLESLQKQNRLLLTYEETPVCVIGTGTYRGHKYKKVVFPGKEAIILFVGDPSFKKGK